MSSVGEKKKKLSIALMVLGEKVVIRQFSGVMFLLCFSLNELGEQ